VPYFFILIILNFQQFRNKARKKKIEHGCEIFEDVGKVKKSVRECPENEETDGEEEEITICNLAT
jgi:hypothetical protein